ncbi:hypothetical protein B0T20DRAFT_494169 [Sordaria brevicollis]|uniref:Uncharacterized protein n=1 Tax=Sordaria brevicollis TaxID=83679 RepID=A0AAE0PI69_SORBR|nr:hypothetical protein B0T20DRAFT_494169 [Sordaria brevicollis]
MSKRYSRELASDLGVPRVTRPPPPPPPVPNPLARRRRVGKEKIEADKRFRIGGNNTETRGTPAPAPAPAPAPRRTSIAPPKPTTTSRITSTASLNRPVLSPVSRGSPMPRATSMVSVARRKSTPSVVTAKVPRPPVQFRRASTQIRDDEPPPFNRTAPQARVRKMLVADNVKDTPSPPPAGPMIRAFMFAAVKKPTTTNNGKKEEEGKAVRPTRKGANIVDPSYRPLKTIPEEGEDSSEFGSGDEGKPDLEWGLGSRPDGLKTSATPPAHKATKAIKTGGKINKAVKFEEYDEDGNEGKDGDEPTKGPKSKTNKGANVLDPSYRPSKKSPEEGESSEYESADEEKPDLEWGLEEGGGLKGKSTAAQGPTGKGKEVKTDKVDENEGKDGDKPTKGQKARTTPGGNVLDPSYRPPKTLDHSSSSEYDTADEEDPDLDWGMGSGPGRRPVIEQSSPPSSVSPPAPRIRQQPPRAPQPPIPRKRKHLGNPDDTTYRPSKDELWSPSDSDFSSSDLEIEDPDLDWGLTSAATKVAEEGSPPTSLEVERPSSSPSQVEVAPNQLGPRKRRRLNREHDPNYKPLWDSEDESSWEDTSSEEFDEGIAALEDERPKKGKAKRKGTNKRLEEQLDDVKQEPISDVDLEKSIELQLVEEVGPHGYSKEETAAPAKNKKKPKSSAIFDPTYRPSKDSEDSTDEYSEYTSSSDGSGTRNRRRRNKATAPRAKVDDKKVKTEKDDNRIPSKLKPPQATDMVTVQPKPEQQPPPHIPDIPDTEIEILQPPPSSPFLPTPRIGPRRKTKKQRRIHDPNYQPSSTSSTSSSSWDSDSDDSTLSNLKSTWNLKTGETKTSKKPKHFQIPKELESVSQLHRDEIERLLDGTRLRFRPLPDGDNTIAKEGRPQPVMGLGVVPEIRIIPVSRSASGSVIPQKRKRPRWVGRQDSDGLYHPSESGSENWEHSDEYSDDWSSSTSSGLEFKWKKNKKNKPTKTKTKPAQNQTPPKPKPKMNSRDVEMTISKEARERLGASTPLGSIAPLPSPPATRTRTRTRTRIRTRKTKRRRVAGDEDGSYHPSTSSYSSSSYGSESEDESLPGLDHSPTGVKVRNYGNRNPNPNPNPNPTPTPTPKLNFNFSPPTPHIPTDVNISQLLPQPSVEIALPVPSHLKPQPTSSSISPTPNPLTTTPTHTFTTFYPLSHPHPPYTPHPPPPGTTYCPPCFRSHVLVRTLLIRRGIGNTLELLKTALGGGDDGDEFGKELNEVLDKIGRAVERVRVGDEEMGRREFREGVGYGLVEGEEDKAGGKRRGGRRGAETETERGGGDEGGDVAVKREDMEVEDGTSSIPDQNMKEEEGRSSLPEDVQTLVVLRRLVDLVLANTNTNTNTTTATTRPKHPSPSPSLPQSTTPPPKPTTITTLPIPIPIPSKHLTSLYHLTGPDRYSSPYPPPSSQHAHPQPRALFPPVDDTNHHIPPQTTVTQTTTLPTSTTTTSHPYIPESPPLEKVMNALHDAMGVSPWQARRLWKRYPGRKIWEVGKVDRLVGERVRRSRTYFQAEDAEEFQLDGGGDLEGQIQIEIRKKLLTGNGNRNGDAEMELGDEDMISEEVERFERVVREGFAAAAAAAEMGRRRRREVVARLTLTGSDEDKTGAVTVGVSEGDTHTHTHTQSTATTQDKDQEGKKRARDDDDDHFTNTAIHPPRKIRKLVKPMELALFNNTKVPKVPKVPNGQPTTPTPELPSSPPPPPPPPPPRTITIPCHTCSPPGFNKFKAVNYDKPSRDDEEKPWLKTLQLALSLNDSEAAAAKMKPSNLLDYLSGSGGGVAHVTEKGWEFLVYLPDGQGAQDDEEREGERRRIVFLGVKGGLEG